jgi:hypothetical protein
VVEGIPVDRARLRFTATYAINERLSLGIEANPLDDDYGPLANWRVLDETARRPALILGTSSDRIGTPSGRAVFATLSKDLESWSGLPIAPYAGIAFGDYAGIAFGEYEDEWREVAGLRIRWAERLTTTSLWDGVNLHHTIDWAFDGGWRAGAVVVEQEGD